jgi:acetyl esterase/lipase
MRPGDAHPDSAGPATPGPGGVDDLDGARVAAETFASALRAAIATGATDARTLRDAVRQYVIALRERGAPPERALIAVKEHVFDAVRRRAATPTTETSALLRRVVHWAIEAYYRAD